MKKYFIPILTLIFVVLVAALWFLQSDETQDGAESDQRTFRSAQSSLSFSYPSEFGEVEETVQDSTSTDGVVTSGKGLNISFEKNSNVYMVLVSREYQAFKELYFTGSKSVAESCPEPRVDERGNGCVITHFGDTEWLQQTQSIADEGVFTLMHTYSRPILRSSEYFGVMIVQSYPSIFEELNDISDQTSRERLAQQYAEELLGIKGVITNDDIQRQQRTLTEIVETVSL